MVKAIPDLQTVRGWENIRESSDLTGFGAGGRWSKPQASSTELFSRKYSQHRLVRH